MKLAASNIGWAPENLGTVLPRLGDHSVEGLVIAPTMVWPEAPDVTAAQAQEFRVRAEDAGLAIVGMQSLTYGRNGIALSGTPEDRSRMTEHLKRQADLAGRLGVASLIFGSPNVRQDVDEGQAVEVFGKASIAAAENGTRLCIEPLSGYGNEFVTTTVAGVQFVQRMQREGYGAGFGLHLDSAAIAGQPNPNAELDIVAADALVGITSFDASAPGLLPPSREQAVSHDEMAAALRVAGYAGFISLEMRQPDGEDPVEAFFSEVDFVRDQYGLSA